MSQTRSIASPEREGEKGGEVWGRAVGPPIVLGPSGALLAGHGDLFQPPPPAKEARCIFLLFLLAVALSPRATLAEESKCRSCAHFFLSLEALHLSRGHGEWGAHSYPLPQLPLALSWGGQVGGPEAVSG